MFAFLELYDFFFFKVVSWLQVDLAPCPVYSIPPAIQVSIHTFHVNSVSDKELN